MHAVRMHCNDHLSVKSCQPGSQLPHYQNFALYVHSVHTVLTPFAE